MALNLFSVSSKSAENSVVCLNYTEKHGVNLGDSLSELHNLGDSYNLGDSDLHNLGQSDSYCFGDLSNTAESSLSLILETKTLESFEEYAVNYDTTLKSPNKALMTSTPRKIPVISGVADISDDNYDFGLFDYSVNRTLIELEPTFGISSSEHESSCYMGSEISTKLRCNICPSSPYEFNEDDTETLHLASTEILSLSSGFEGTSYLASSRSESSINENVSVYSDASIGMTEMYHDVRATFPQEETKPLLESQSHPERSRLLARHTKVASIQKDLKSCRRCCSKVCTKKFSLVEVKNMRLEFWSKTINGRNQWLLKKFSETNMEYTPYFRIQNGHVVCPKALMRMLGIHKNFYYSNRKKFIGGARFSVSERHYCASIKSLQAINWLEEYATYYVDRMPDCNTLLLPYRTRQCMIYIRYKEDMKERSEEFLMPSAFYGMWKKYLPNLKVKKTNSFSKCTVCTSLERQIETTHDPVMREKLRAERREHNSRQMLERKYYYTKKNAAKTSPSQYLSLIIDGMDQSKTNLPHFVGRMAKAVNKVDQLTTHVTGVLAHGQNKFFTFLDWNQYAHDSNLTMNILMLILHQISKLMGNKLPPILYLQADNCWRENKNRYVLGFCELLVHQRIFNEVHLSFLPVGHTHEDVDAAFSRIAETLRRNDAETMPRLKEMLPNVKDIEAIYDIRSWITSSLNDIRKHTKPLHYKFIRDLATHNVKMQYKAFQDSEWKTEHGIIQLISGKPNLPKGIPKVINPQFEKIDINKIKSRIPQWQCLFTDQIEHTEQKWWGGFLGHLEKIRDSLPYRRTKVLSKAKWILPLLPKQQLKRQRPSVDQDIPAELRRLLENEREECFVQVQPKQQKKDIKRK
ncbi:uncharacterized protein [Mytilus edulis]|uniref:uncharacterized protein n=1 Tax=Mytilus edulis TaxID=6550 RepID=UPI0039EE93CA